MRAHPLLTVMAGALTALSRVLPDRELDAVRNRLFSLPAMIVE